MKSINPGQDDFPASSGDASQGNLEFGYRWPQAAFRNEAAPVSSRDSGFREDPVKQYALQTCSAKAVHRPISSLRSSSLQVALYLTFAPYPPIQRSLLAEISLKNVTFTASPYGAR